MKTKITSVVAKFLLVLLMLVPFLHAEANGVVPGYVLVRIQPWTGIGDVLSAVGIDSDDNNDAYEQVPNTYLYAVATPRGESEKHFVARLRAVNGVAYAETDTFTGDPKSVPLDRFPPPEALFANSVSNLISQKSSPAEIVNAGLAPLLYLTQPAYNLIDLGTVHSYVTGKGIKVAVLDTGVNPNHPTLYGRCTQGYNAFDKDLPPYEYYDGTHNGVVGHGTMIASLIARIAPNAEIVPVRVMNGDGVGTGFAAIKGLVFAVGEGAKVVNLSFGTNTRLHSLEEMVRMAIASGSVVVASAGNNGVTQPHYPAALPGVIGVASVTSAKTKSDFSNYGSWVSVSAPGNDILGAHLDGGYARWSGTSFAAPFVAAQATLLLERDPYLTPASVRQRIRSTARSLNQQNPSLRGLLGTGLISISNSVLSTPKR